MPQPANATAAAVPWLPVAAIVLAGVAAALLVGKVPVALARMQQEFGVSLATVSWVMSVFPVIGVVGGIAAGVVVGRLGDRRVMAVGLCTMAVASIGGAYAPGFSALIATRVLEGLGFLLFVVAAPAALQRLAPPARRPLVMGVWSTYMPCGIALAMLLGAQLPAWHSVWLICAAVLVAALLLLLAMVPAASQRPAPQALARVWGNARATLRSQPAWLLALSFMTYNLQFFAVMGFLPIFLVQRMAMPAGTAAVVTAGVVCMNIIGNLAAGMLVSRGVRPAHLLVAAALAMGLCGAGVFVPGMPNGVVIALCFVFSGIGGVLPATILLSAPATAPQPVLVPLYLGLVMRGNYLGQLLGPVLVGSIVASAGWPAAMWPVLASACVCAWLGWRFGRLAAQR